MYRVDEVGDNEDITLVEVSDRLMDLLDEVRDSIDIIASMLQRR